LWDNRLLPHYQVGDKTIKPSTNLLSLFGGFVLEIVPPSILADALQEEHPELEIYANFLREWEKCATESSPPNP
jgi:hypothetical protein